VVVVDKESTVNEMLLLIGSINSSSCFPQYLIKAVLELAKAVAFVIITILCNQ